jgi:hypothetical protein
MQLPDTNDAGVRNRLAGCEGDCVAWHTQWWNRAAVSPERDTSSRMG